ncbi:hypothetical protein DFI02_102790 [Rhizobium sp. PP-F2F-G20b]|nr:hypothetical protein DFI02_102790 [Rhizobium sp. PP-F2F-G20b]
MVDLANCERGSLVLEDMMRTSKQVLHGPHARYSNAASTAALPSFHAVLRTLTLVAAFAFIGACVFGAI